MVLRRWRGNKYSRNITAYEKWIRLFQMTLFFVSHDESVERLPFEATLSLK